MWSVMSVAMSWWGLRRRTTSSAVSPQRAGVATESQPVRHSWRPPSNAPPAATSGPNAPTPGRSTRRPEASSRPAARSAEERTAAPPPCSSPRRTPNAERRTPNPRGHHPRSLGGAGTVSRQHADEDGRARRHRRPGRASGLRPQAPSAGGHRPARTRHRRRRERCPGVATAPSRPTPRSPRQSNSPPAGRHRPAQDLDQPHQHPDDTHARSPPHHLRSRATAHRAADQSRAGRSPGRSTQRNPWTAGSTSCYG